MLLDTTYDIDENGLKQENRYKVMKHDILQYLALMMYRAIFLLFYDFLIP